MATSVADKDNQLPSTFQLSQNYPNPFNPSTNIVYALDEAQNITLEVFNMNGQHVSTLFSGFQSSGRHQLLWNAEGLPTGSYILRLRSAKQSVLRRMMLVK
jgi:hypothetical protein